MPERCFPTVPADFLHTPNLKKLAARSARFQNAYTGSPLCAPARASFMAGSLPRRTRVYDNAAEFAPDIPTYAHHLRRAGYQTSLSGKMHFVGPDQMHGFEERLTTDVYPADYGWTPDYRKPGERIDWWYHNMGSVTGAGIGEITNQLEYDDEVAYEAVRKIYDLGRRKEDRPFMLTVSRSPIRTTPMWRARNTGASMKDCDHLQPSRSRHARLRCAGQVIRSGFWTPMTGTRPTIDGSRTSAMRDAPISPMSPISMTRSAKSWRRSMASVSSDDTIVFVLSDHGDMLGERGLVVQDELLRGLGPRAADGGGARQLTPGLVETPASSIDMTPTLADTRRHIDLSEILNPGSDGESLLPIAAGNAREKLPVRMEYAAEGLRGAAGLRSARAGSNIITVSSIRPSSSTLRPIRTS